MAGEFDFGLGSDPFGGGPEGMTNFGSNAADIIKAGSSPVVLPDISRGEDSGGLFSLAKGLVGRGEDPGQPAAPGRPGGGILSDLGGLIKGAIPAAQLGIAGLGIKSSLDAAGAARQQGRDLRQMQQIQRESAQPLQQFGTTQLNRAQAGQVDPAIQAQIDQWAQAEKIKIQQFFATNKIGDSTMLQSALADIDAKAVAMKSGNLQMMEQLGISALNQAGQIGTTGAATASREQNQLDALIAESNKALAALSGSV